MWQNFWKMVSQKYALEHLLFPSNESNDSKKKKRFLSSAYERTRRFSLILTLQMIEVLVS